MQIIKYAKRTKPYVDGHWDKIFGSAILALFLAGLKAAQAYIVKPIFDQGLSPDSTIQDTLWTIFLFTLIILFNFPVRFFHFYWIRKVVTRAQCNLREDLNRKLSKLPLSFFVKNKQGALISQIMNDTIVFSLGFRGAVDLIREPVTAIFMLGLALYRDWQLTMIVLGFGPLFYYVLTKSGKKVLVRQTLVQEKIADLTHAVTEGIGAQKLTKAFSLSGFVNRRFRDNQEDFFHSQIKTMTIEEILHPITELIASCAFIGIIFFAHYRIQSGVMTPGDFVSFITAMVLIVDPIRKYASANIRFNQAVAAGDRLFNLLDEPNEVDNGNLQVKSFENSIEVKDLHFSYVPERPILRGVNISIKKGEKVAFVGMSGSGKSTLVNLLLGLYPVKSKSIFIDNTPVEDIKLDSLRSLFGFVSQDIFLFNDTILENLTLGQKVSPEKLNEAIEVAHAKEFIEDLPDKLNTVIGDRGAKLSGGQRQRLTIARAFLRNSDILLFDEATSALDNESENVVQQALDEISKDKTVVAVAHRLSTIQDFDKIYVFDQGKIVEQGTHDELISKKEYYFRLYELSKKG